MSKAEILAELPKLTPAERQEVRLKLARLDGEEWLDSGDPLTDAEKALLDARLAEYGKDSDAGSSWEEVETRIRARLIIRPKAEIARGAPYKAPEGWRTPKPGGCSYAL
jgi:putative addiction module component (TIGR02574 family)